jgi:lipoyl(octanoyl) transferase
MHHQDLGSVDYRAAWEVQRQAHAAVADGGPETVLLLEHPPVFTCGKRTTPDERPLDPGGAEVIDVDRGGKITFHGPGQLVGYPIIKLKNKAGIRDYVERLEAVIIAVLADYGIDAVRIKGRAGVWIEHDEKGPDRKIAAIGIRVNEGVTMHGFAINCNNDLAPYGQIIACGISDAGVTTITQELGRDVTPADLVSRITEELRNNEHALVATPEGALL